MYLFCSEQNAEQGPIKNHKKLQVTQSTHCFYSKQLNSLARVSADYVPDKIVRYCVWHFVHKKKHSGTVKSVLLHKDHNTVYNSQILRHWLGVWLQYSLHLADFLQKWAITQNKTVLADCPLKNFAKTGVFPTSIFRIHSPTAIPNSSHKQIHTAEQCICTYYKATSSNNYFQLFMHNICVHKLHKDQHWSHQMTWQHTVNMHMLIHPLSQCPESNAPLL